MSQSAGTPTSSCPSEGAKEFVAQIKEDSALLLRFISSRYEKKLADLSTGNNDVRTISEDYKIIFENGVESDQAKILSLVSAFDQLSQRAAPASVQTIRFTNEFLGINYYDRKYEKCQQSRAKKSQLCYLFVQWIAIVSLLFSVFLLAYLDYGRRIVQQLQDNRHELTQIFADLRALPADSWMNMVRPPAGTATQPQLTAPPPGTGDNGSTEQSDVSTPFMPFCDPERPVADVQAARAESQLPDSSGLFRYPRSSEHGSRASQLCGRLGEARVRQNLIFERIAAWNATYCYELIAKWMPGCTHRPFDWIAEGSREYDNHWRRTEIRTIGTMSVISGFILPLLLGCLGGSVYALRDLHQRLGEWTLDVRDHRRALLRIGLATILGGLMGAVFGSDQSIHVGNISLSLAAAAFFIGYSVEVVFTMIERMVDGALQTVRAAPPPVPTVVQISVPPSPPAVPPPPAQRAPRQAAQPSSTPVADNPPREGG